MQAANRGVKFGLGQAKGESAGISSASWKWSQTSTSYLSAAPDLTARHSGFMMIEVYLVSTTQAESLIRD